MHASHEAITCSSHLPPWDLSTAPFFVMQCACARRGSLLRSCGTDARPVYQDDRDIHV
jgi:hypothetical protein